MGITVHRVEYFHTTVSGDPGDAFELLTHLAHLGVNLVAMASVPLGPEATQLTLFPEDSAKLQSATRSASLALNGPHAAVLVRGDDVIGAIANIHRRLHQSGVEVYASSGVTDGQGHFGYVLYVRKEDAARATQALSG